MSRIPNRAAGGGIRVPNPTGNGTGRALQSLSTGLRLSGEALSRIGRARQQAEAERWQLSVQQQVARAELAAEQEAEPGRVVQTFKSSLTDLPEQIRGIEDDGVRSAVARTFREGVTRRLPAVHRLEAQRLSAQAIQSVEDQTRQAIGEVEREAQSPSYHPGQFTLSPRFEQIDRAVEERVETGRIRRERAEQLKLDARSRIVQRSVMALSERDPDTAEGVLDQHSEILNEGTVRTLRNQVRFGKQRIREEAVDRIETAAIDGDRELFEQLVESAPSELDGDHQKRIARARRSLDAVQQNQSEADRIIEGIFSGQDIDPQRVTGDIAEEIDERLAEMGHSLEQRASIFSDPRLPIPEGFRQSLDGALEQDSGNIQQGISALHRVSRVSPNRADNIAAGMDNRSVARASLAALKGEPLGSPKTEEVARVLSDPGSRQALRNANKVVEADTDDSLFTDFTGAIQSSEALAGTVGGDLAVTENMRQELTDRFRYQMARLGGGVSAEDGKEIALDRAVSEMAQRFESVVSGAPAVQRSTMAGFTERDRQKIRDDAAQLDAIGGFFDFGAPLTLDFQRAVRDGDRLIVPQVEGSSLQGVFVYDGDRKFSTLFEPSDPEFAELEETILRRGAISNPDPLLWSPSMGHRSPQEASPTIDRAIQQRAESIFVRSNGGDPPEDEEDEQTIREIYRRIAIGRGWPRAFPDEDEQESR